MDVKPGDIMATIWIHFTLHRERQFTEFGKYLIKSNIINKSCPINSVLEKKEY